MALKFIALFALVAVASAGLIPTSHLSYASHHSAVHAPLAIHAAPIHKQIIEHYDHHPQYQYSYNVHDPHTGDIKSQHESRDGDVVRGSYSLLEADGTKRIVEYTADDHNGFNAVVRKEGYAHHVTPVHAAPIALNTYSSPVHYASNHHLGLY